jgi:PAS domain S-box-containing protein
MPAGPETGNPVPGNRIASATDQNLHSSLPASPLRILVADDNAINRKLLRVTLQLGAHTVFEAENGVAALQFLEAHDVDAVISDILMPEMDGYRLCHEIRKSPKFKNLPFVIYTSSYLSQHDEQVAMQFGADGFIRKPSSEYDILECLYKVLATANERESKVLERSDEADVMREYSQVLVRKLEKTIVDLSEANKFLAERTTLAEYIAAVSAALSQAGGLSEMLQGCCDAMVKHLEAPLARIWTFNEKENVLELQASAGLYTGIEEAHSRIPIGQFDIGLIALDRLPHLTNGVLGDRRFHHQEWAKREGLDDFAGYPLLIGDQLVGVMALFSRRPISQNTFDFMGSVAQNIAVGIRRQLSERELRQSEEFRSMMENLREHSIVTLDPAGRVLTWSKGAETVMGYRADEIIGMHFSRFYTATDVGLGKPEQNLQTALAVGQCENEGWRVRNDGSRFWGSVVITAVRTKKKLVGFTHVARDVTRQHREEELKFAKEKAEAANEAKSAFLANVSHEIRTPMTGIFGMAGLLNDTALTNKQREYCNIIRQSADSLLTIINDVLDFSKVEAGKLELEIIDFDLRSAVEEVTALFSQQAVDKGVELIHFIRFDVPTYLQGDPGRLRQILSNLIGNALKFTSAGEVVIRVNVVDQPKAAVTLRFEISDTGIGIPRGKIDKLFKPFIQADASTTRKYGGTGLGLALCKQFVDLMGGQIGVISEAGRGSTVWFTVQLLKSQDSGRISPQPSTDLHGLRMLIVEGNSTSRAVLDHYLTSLGIRHQSAEDGPAALELIRVAAEKTESFDLVLLDFMLAGTDGMELARTIRQNPKFGSPKLLLLTSVGKKEDAKLAQQVGIDGYLTKPVSFSELFGCLSVLMGETPEGDGHSSLVTFHNIAELKSQTRLRVLVADDNHINQKVVSSLLANMGHHADVVGNGKEAIEAYSFIPYDLVLMDLQMPEMDGFESSLRIRTLARMEGRRTAIIAITAHARKEDKEKCIAAGFDDYVSKPILPYELKAAIERTIIEVGSHSSPQSSTEAGSGDAVVDTADALARVEGNKELLGEIQRLFLDQYPKLFTEIHQAFLSANCKALAEASHTLGSSAGQLGAQRALAAARRLEDFGERKDHASVPAALADLEAELKLVESVLVQQAYSSPQSRTPAN